MKFPFTSFALAIIIWIFFIAVFFYSATQKSTIIPATLEVDASIVDNVSRRIENRNIIHKDDAKNSAEKNKILQEKSAANANEASGSSKLNKVATIVARPLPEIPEDLREEAFNSFAIARFYIAADGSTTVELIKPCNNPRLNQLLLQNLHKWKFAPAVVAGVATASTQDIKVNFKVE